ncbi:hypothetical protein CAL29_11580 [Bordetella genomosp. 10]|uniref:Right handed beta helix domain-containing protein n=1 Tax=Bordetella genomosp. 10 TaxID=1416804 RepID=A0A261SAS1_9BORD|nr:hypothetical protein [Bordetella genomosp. 10]OZI34181.1 hypothetical protein CAL29_11580 [Bordetella genomosp. 10]
MTASAQHTQQVFTVADLQGAAANTQIAHIQLAADLTDAPTLRLSPGQTLSGPAAIRFAAGHDGLQLTSDNRIENLTLVADADKRAVFNDTRVAQLGRLALRGLVVTGVVQLLARDQVRGGHVEVHDIDIVAADARGYDERPKGYGVEVIPGAFTLWNQQTDPAVTITADLTGLSAGRAGAPVRGSGIFVSGAGDVGGRLVARRLETGAVYSDGGIAKGTPDRITGGVFTVYGAFVDSVRNLGPVTTYGPNDMVLDNWGMVDRWVAEDKITSYGPSGIGFVNFGTVNVLRVNAAIETFGQGARGFNVYTGTVQSAEFERVVTHADGAVGIQISQPVGRIAVRRGIETHGGTGDSLVKGVVVTLSAIGLSVKPGGSAREIDIAGGIVTHGEGVNALELHGSIDTFRVGGGLVTAGGGFDKI